MRSKRVYILALFLVLASVAPAFAGKARIDDIRVVFAAQPTLNFVVRDAFTRDIEEAVNSGIPTTFTFKVRLVRKKGLWFDEHIGTWKFNHTVKYDALKEEYEVILGEKNRREKTKDSERMKTLMITGEDVAISPIPALKPGARYEFGLMAELDTVSLPVPLNYMLFFVHLWDFKTDWFRYGFVYR